MNKYIYRIFGLLVALLFSELLQAQHFGMPGIRNFSRAEYKGGTQNWAVAQAANGMLYFGNNNGLVEYDGIHWTVYQDMGLVIRSLFIDENRIYVGAFDKFGYYEEDKNGILRYHSLVHLIKNRIGDFDEIWRIHKTSFGIVFQSYRALFIYNQGKIDVVYPKTRFHFSYYVNRVLWVYDESAGLLQYKDGKLIQIPGGNLLVGSQIWTVLPLADNQVIIGTARNGLYKYDGKKLTEWDKPVNVLLKKYQIYTGALVDNRYFAFGTIQNGLIISDTAGEMVFEINKDRGLANNTVLGIGTDQEGNIWLGLDNGISVVHFNSQLTFIQKYFNIGSGYASARFGDKLYLGTNQGLFYINWSDFINPLKRSEDFHLIAGTEGQVWCLTIIDSTLLCGHNSGVFQVLDKTAVRISSVPGGWNMIKSGSKPSLLIVGNYSGLSVLERKGLLWEYKNEISGFNQSSHYLEQDSKGDIWISHGYKGIFRLKTDSGLQKVIKSDFYDSKKGLPSDQGNTLFKLKSGIVAGTRKGIYRYNEPADNFQPDMQLNQLFPDPQQIDYLNQDDGRNIWYYNNQQPGVLRFQEDGSYTNITAPFVELSGMVIPAFGHVNAINSGNALIGLESGFGHYNSTQPRQYNFSPVLYLSKIKSGDTSEGTFRFNSSYLRQEVIPEFKYKNNTIGLSFSAGQYTDQGISFQFQLNGFDKTWSAWTQQNSKEYTNLPAGEYVFQFRALTSQGKLTKVLSYKFRILHPWYTTIYAWFIYLLLIVFLLYTLYRVSLKRVEKSHLKETEAQRTKYKQRELQLKEAALLAEMEMSILRNEKLNLEIIHKEKELANATMSIIQKNGILTKLKNELSRIKNVLNDDTIKNELGKYIKHIGKEIDNEKQWQVFNMHVEQVHEDLFKKLKTQNTDLSPSELRLCAYLRMNISSKEIATLMNISTRGVEISRYRIRKKLGIDRNINLTDFMMKL